MPVPRSTPFPFSFILFEAVVGAAAAVGGDGGNGGGGGGGWNLLVDGVDFASGLGGRIDPCASVSGTCTLATWWL